MAKAVSLVALILALSVIHSSAIPFTQKDLESEESFKDLFERWLSHNGLARDLDDKTQRFNVFKDNVKYIHEFNNKDHTYELALNKFGAMTNEEFRNTYAGSKINHHETLRGESHGGSFMYEKVKNIPASVDWRQNGAITAVKNQGHCGSGWAFSTTAAVEGLNYITEKELTSLSEQHLIDCVTNNAGCNGGLMDYAFDYINFNGGISSEDDYPYIGVKGTCKPSNPAATIDGYEDVPQNNEKALMNAVAHQPVSVAIEAKGRAFQFYHKGVFKGPCGTELDHGVAVVGYGATLSGTKYWIVKNSWGLDWGEDGYIRMERDIIAETGLCGIAMEASYPIKTKHSANPIFSEELYLQNQGIDYCMIANVICQAMNVVCQAINVVCPDIN